LPKNSSPSRRSTQVKRRNAELAQRRLAREANKVHRAYTKHVERVRKQERIAQEKLLRNVLRSVKGTGIYEPRSLELTRYRKARAKKVHREYGKYLDRKEYFFVKAPKARRAEVRERAEGLHLKSTPTGVFVEREGHKTASIKENKKNKELYIARKGRTKRGPLKGRVYTSILPLASIDELDNERDRLRELAKTLPLRNKRERLAFKVRENGIEGYSHSTFESVEGIIRYLDKYPKGTSARINFYRHIELERVETGLEWNLTHPPMNKAQRIARLRQSAEAIRRGSKRPGR
jgi:hypothetical protein